MTLEFAPSDSHCVNDEFEILYPSSFHIRIMHSYALQDYIPTINASSPNPYAIHEQIKPNLNASPFIMHSFNNILLLQPAPSHRELCTSPHQTLFSSNRLPS